MSLQRLYSKAKGNGNHVTGTGLETIPVPFQLPGLVSNSAEFGILRITGRAVYCMGFRADFNVPAGDQAVKCNVGLRNGTDGVLATNGRLYLNGVTLGGDLLLTPALLMPVNSIWKLRVEIESDEEEPEFFPQGLTVTYWLRYAQGPVFNPATTPGLTPQGIGFDAIGSTFVIP